MAGYSSNNRGYSSNSNYSKPAPNARPAGAEGKKDILFSTGMFPARPRQDGSKSKVLGEVQVKETLTIPAGSRLKLIPVDASKYAEGKTVPVYQLLVTEGQLRAPAKKQ